MKTTRAISLGARWVLREGKEKVAESPSGVQRG